MFEFNHTAISVSDLDKTLEFYKKLGFTVKQEYFSSEVDIVMLSLNGYLLEVFHYAESFALPQHSKELGTDLKTIGTKHFALGVKDILKAKDFVEKNKLCSGEIKIVQGRLGKPYFFITDPDGIFVEIIESK